MWQSCGEGSGRVEGWKIGRVEDWKDEQKCNGRTLIEGIGSSRSGAMRSDITQRPVKRSVNFRLYCSESPRSRLPPSNSIHRNIAEGYCRRSLSEYLHFLNIALASTGESVSGLHAFQAAKQIADVDLEHLDAIAFKLENGLKRLIESLQKKKLTGTWDDSFVIRETNAEYEIREVWIDRQSESPTDQAPEG